MLSPEKPRQTLQAWEVRSKVTSPGAACVANTDLKLLLGISGTDHDSILTEYATVADDMAQRWTGRRFVNSTVTAYISVSDFGRITTPILEGMNVGIDESIFGFRRIRLPWLPLVSVTSIFTYDSDGDGTEFAASNYLVVTDSNDLNGEIVLQPEASWPVDLQITNSVRVIYVAGYGASASDVPAAIRAAVKRLAIFMYSNRGDCGSEEEVIQASGAASLLAPFRLMRI